MYGFGYSEMVGSKTKLKANYYFYFSNEMIKYILLYFNKKPNCIKVKFPDFTDL